MADQQSGGLLGLPVGVWIALIIGVAGVFAISQKPFQDTRPPNVVLPLEQEAPDGGQNIEARTWEDPLSAVSLALKATEAKSGESNSVDVFLAYDPGELGKAIQLNIRNNRKTLVLAVMINGGPYTDDIETRRRARYAVVAGLYRSRFIPAKRDHVGFIYTTPSGSAGLAHKIAVFEWFDRDNSVVDQGTRPARGNGSANTPRTSQSAPGPQADELTKSDRVLLLWLDQEGFRDLPIRKLSELLKSIAGDEHPLVTHAILGPADSDGLRAMYKEVQESRPEAQVGAPHTVDKQPWPPDLLPLLFYSSRATASDAYVLDDEQALPGAFAAELNRSSPKLQFFRTVTDDQRVATELVKELESRGIAESEIALVAERDTLYARGMGHYFKGCWNAPSSDPDPWAVGRWRDTDKVRCFTYLRGLDGLTPTGARSGNSTQSQTAKSDSSTATDSSQTGASDEAIGPRQLDYLRRLADTIVDIRQATPRIKAIGVVSSDVYDKLLVLQALRAALPNVTFFTFDLDARFLEPGNLKWTRQLLVGSSLGLSLRGPLQGDIPPFRDTYQTSTFFATLLAVHRFVSSPRAQAIQSHQPWQNPAKLTPPNCPARGEKSANPDAKERSGPALAELLLFDPTQRARPGLQWTDQPRIFEIGRSQAFDLIDEPERAKCDLDRCCAYIAAVRSSWLWNDRVWSFNRLVVGAIAAALCMIAAAAAFGIRGVVGMSRAHRIPFLGMRRWDNGIAWAIFVAVLLSLTVIAWPWVIDWITQGLTRVPTPLFGGASQWTAEVIDAAAIVIALVLVVRGQRKLYDNAEAIRREFGFQMNVRQLVDWHRKQLMPRRLRQRGLALFWFPIRPLPRQSGMALATTQVSQLEAIMAQYLHRGTPLARFVRVFCVTLISGVLLLVAELIVGITILRVSITKTSMASLFATQFLILWTADAVFLSRSFLLALWRDQPDWPAAAINRAYAAIGVRKDWTTLWLNLRLIARRTSGVANLVWYPSLVIAALAIASLTNEFKDFQFANNPIALLVGALFVVASAIALRRAAEFWRGRVKHQFEDERLLAQQAQSSSAVQQLESLLERVGALHEGAFAPYSEQPIVRAVLIPAVTYGATLGLQHGHLGL